LTICSNHSHRFIKEPWVTPERVTPKSCYPFKKLQTFLKHPNNYQTYQTKKQKKTKMKNKLTTCKKKQTNKRYTIQTCFKQNQLVPNKSKKFIEVSHIKKTEQKR
jgi:hypothetical protein